MKYALLGSLLLVGCSTVVDGVNYHWAGYTNKFKQGIPPQEVVDVCARKGHTVTMENGGVSGFMGLGGGGTVYGARAFDSCMKGYGFTASNN